MRLRSQKARRAGSSFSSSYSSHHRTCDNRRCTSGSRRRTFGIPLVVAARVGLGSAEHNLVELAVARGEPGPVRTPFLHAPRSYPAHPGQARPLDNLGNSRFRLPFSLQSPATMRILVDISFVYVFLILTREGLLVLPHDLGSVGGLKRAWRGN